MHVCAHNVIGSFYRGNSREKLVPFLDLLLATALHCSTVSTAKTNGRIVFHYSVVRIAYYWLSCGGPPFYHIGGQFF